MNNPIKAVGLLSGGLDSLLAAKIIKKLNVLIYGLHIIIPFNSKFEDAEKLDSFCDKNSILLNKVKAGPDYIDIIKDPIYGYGKNINPCIDCHIYMLKKAKSLMKEKNADFVFTGEVLNERPMSQTKSILRLIEKESGLEGYLIRPLSAKHLKPTVPEEKGIIDRNKMYDIIGRSRKKQFELAEKFELKKFPTPGGGCLLTDSQFAKRLRTVLDLNIEKQMNLNILKYGRLFKLPNDTLLIIGRNELENEKILELADESDIKLTLIGIKGSYGIIKNLKDKEDLKIAGAICARYSKIKGKSYDVEVKVWYNEKDDKYLFKTKPFTEKETYNYLVY